MLEGHVIHGLSSTNCLLDLLNLLLATQYWTENNIADGLTALATCIEASDSHSPFPAITLIIMLDTLDGFLRRVHDVGLSLVRICRTWKGED